MSETRKSFIRDEDGAVTVDWVVLTAAVVALAGVAITAIHGGTGNVATTASDRVISATK
ncbi:hypothetical protein [Ruegeria arenilitoris]|uniref:hypothetical protein n=1 Tax=Ruegeria arenilitoris TaxID=1173585 RepID=UPI0014800BC6|nr:hypothetical protein [Ruegeria arenilitoris]